MTVDAASVKAEFTQDLTISWPSWLNQMAEEHADWFTKSWTHEERMQLAIDLSRWNVDKKGGGPFGAAIFDESSGRLIAWGVNRVEFGRDPTAHAEVMAIRMACQRVAQFNLAQASQDFALYSSAEPCCLCVGAVLWSGLKRVLYAADRNSVEATGFDEGPQTLLEDLEKRGVQLVHMPGNDDCFLHAATNVLVRYHESGGLIYNGG